jgi:hypothetical protein
VERSVAIDIKQPSEDRAVTGRFEYVHRKSPQSV